MQVPTVGRALASMQGVLSSFGTGGSHCLRKAPGAQVVRASVGLRVVQTARNHRCPQKGKGVTSTPMNQFPCAGAGRSDGSGWRVRAMQACASGFGELSR